MAIQSSLAEEGVFRAGALQVMQRLPWPGFWNKTEQSSLCSSVGPPLPQEKEVVSDPAPTAACGGGFCAFHGLCLQFVGF